MGTDVAVKRSAGELMEHTPQAAPIQSPGNYTFDQLVRMASSFAKSGLFGVKDADSALALLLVAHAEGRSPALVMKDFDIIGGRLAKKSEAMLRDFQATGGRVEWVELTDTRAAAKFSHPLAPAPLLIDWDMERAKKAGLAEKTGGMYSKYARAMLRSRCISEGVRSTAPGATSQMYTPEEIRNIETEVDAPVAIQQAVDTAAANNKNPLTKDEVDDLVNTMDVETLPELHTAFGRAFTTAKERGDETAKTRLKSVYDDMKFALENPPTI